MKKAIFKSTIALLIIFIFSTTIFLSGCGKSADPNVSQTSGNKDGEIITLDFMYWDDSEGTKKVFEDYAKNFEAQNKNIKINLQIVPPGDQYYGQLDTRIAGNKAPDVVRLEYQKLGRYAYSDALLDITNEISKENLDDLFPAFKSAVTFNEKIYGIPHHTDTYALFYNKELLQKAGISVPASIDKAWSWDQFLEIARTIKQKTDVKYPFAYRWTKFNGYYVDPLVYMNGASFVNDDFTKANMNTPQGIEFFKFIQTWVKEGMVPSVTPNTPDPIDELFTSGACAMIFSGCWMMENYDKNFKDKWGVTYLLQKDGKSGATFGGNAMSALAQSKHPKEAIKFVEFITNAENSKAICEGAGFLPVRKSLEDGSVKYSTFNDEMQIFIKQSSTIDPMMMKVESLDKFSEINKVFGDSIEKIVALDGQPEQVAKEMDEEVNKILNEK